MDGERIFGIVMFILGTALQIYGWIHFFKNSTFSWGRDFLLVFGFLIMSFVVWFTFPLAWARGMFWDPTIIVAAALGMALFTISGCVESKDSYLRRTGRK